MSDNKEKLKSVMSEFEDTTALLQNEINATQARLQAYEECLDYLTWLKAGVDRAFSDTVNTYGNSVD